jgi:hypothetical protein
VRPAKLSSIDASRHKLQKLSQTKRLPEGGLYNPDLMISDYAAINAGFGGPTARRQERYQRFRATIPFAKSKSRITHVKKTGGPIGIARSETRQINF